MRAQAARGRRRWGPRRRPAGGWISWPRGLRGHVCVCACVTLLAVCAGVLLSPLPGHSTVIVAKTFDDLTVEADLIFVGTVIRLQSRWVDEAQRSIETVVTFSVDEAVLGDLGEEESLRFGGGEIDGLREQIAGVPRFLMGQRVVLFARRDHSISPVIGFHQGCFRVVDGAAGPAVQGCSLTGNAPTLGSETAPLRTGATAGSGTEPSEPSKPSKPSEPEALQDFLARIRRGLGRRPAVP